MNIIWWVEPIAPKIKQDFSLCLIRPHVFPFNNNCLPFYAHTHIPIYVYRKKPNLIVHLDVSPEESLRRIKLRSRDCESSIGLDYLQNLHKAYEVFIADIARIIPVIRVNYERFRTTEEMADMIVR